MTDTLPWTASLQAGEFGQARARAARDGADPLLLAALEDLDALSGAIRARSYAQARRLLVRYQDTARETPLADHFDPSGLDAAMGALEANEGPARPTEVAQLREQLAPAFAHPLTQAEALNALGVLHALREEHADARAAFGEALTRDPQHYRALTNLGNLLLEDGDLDGAEAAYRRALELNRDYPGAHHNLAVVLRKRRRVGESIRALKTSQRLAMRQSRQQGQDEFKQVMGRMKVKANPRSVQVTVGVALAAVLYLALRGFHF